MRAKGFGTEAILAALLKENQARCRPALPQAEVESIARGMERYPPGDPEQLEAESFFENGRFRPARLAARLLEESDPVQYSGGTLYRYGDGYWAEVSDDELGARAKALLRDWATTARIRDAIQLVKYEAQIAPEDFEPVRGFVNLINGMLEVAANKLHPHDPKYNSRSQLPFGFVPKARCPRWLKFLAEVFAADPSQAKALQEWFGYCLTHETFLQVFVIFVGSGANGKGVTLVILARLLGPDNVCAIPLDKMERDFVLVTLKDKLVNLGGEVDTSRRLATSTLKALTGEDTITVDKKYSDPVTFRPTAKHVFTVNEMIHFKDATQAMRRRAVFFLFTESFEGPRCDPELAKKLEGELAGILNWALAGLKTVLRTKKLHKARSAAEYEQQFAEAQNPVLGFVRARCSLADSNGRTPRANVYRAYTLWHHNNIGERPWSKPRFYERLCADFPEVRRVRVHGQDYFKGIRLRKTRTGGKRGKQ